MIVGTIDPEIELTHFSRGENLRFVGDSIRQFDATEAVFLGIAPAASIAL